MAKKNHKSSEEARNTILDAAEKLLVKSGLAGLKISAIANTAGMAHPNIIHHFGSREGLIQALVERVDRQATERITTALDRALTSPPQERVDAMVEVFENAYHGDQGRASVWLHMSGAHSSHKSNMQNVVEVSQRFRKSINPNASRENTNRLVMLITLALAGEIVCGQTVKDSLGFGNDADSRAHFKRWLAEILLSLSDDQLNTSLNKG